MCGTWYGGREKAPAAICRKVIEAKIKGKHEIEIWGSGEKTRRFMYIDDCLKGIGLIMNSDILEPIKAAVILQIGQHHSSTKTRLVL